MDGIWHVSEKNELSNFDDTTEKEVEDDILEGEIVFVDETRRDRDDKLLNLKEETTMEQGEKDIFDEKIEFNKTLCFSDKEGSKQNEFLDLVDIKEETIVNEGMEINCDKMTFSYLNTETKTMLECDICHMTVASKSHLQEHLKSHKGEKQFKCEICDKKFSQKDNLRSHHMLHGAELPFDLNGKMDCPKMNSVAFLMENPFSRLTWNEKIAVKKLKRPMPLLHLENKQSLKGRGIIRKFKLDIYEKNDWICGCDVKNALFCFPCLLFGGEPSWSKNGIRDLIHLSVRISKHENTEDHLRNTLSLTMLGKNNGHSVFDSSYRKAIVKHNEEVKKNRHVLNLIINCIRFCGAFELALRGHDEPQILNNKGIFQESINFTGELDKSFRDHIEAAPVFKRLSKTIRNELLYAMMNVYHEHVANEIKTTDYIAVLADEVTDVTDQFQLVIVFRYIVNGRPVERFWKFLQPCGYDNTLSASILNELNSLVEDSEKIIAQSYNRAAIMSGAINDVQYQYPRANFIHCYSHQTDLIMSHATSSSSNCRIFFANLIGLHTFFSTLPQRAARLEEILHKKGLPNSSKIKWNFNSKTVSTIHEHREEIIQVLEEIEREENLQTTIQQSGAYLRILEDENFIYWLNFFHKIMPHVDLMFNHLQRATTLKINNNLDDFEGAIAKIQTELADTDNDQFVELTPPPSKRQRVPDVSKRNREALEVCDIILLEIKTRLQFTGHLILSNLISFKQFPSYEKQFPEDYLKEAVKFYPWLKENRLRIELSVLYSREEFRQNSETSAVSLLGFLLDGLKETFYEVIKLLKIIITIPMKTSEAERKFSQMKKIKTLVRNSMKDDKLNALTMLSCEKEFINNIANFNEKVIELLCKSTTCKMDFIYR